MAAQTGSHHGSHAGSEKDLQTNSANDSKTRDANGAQSLSDILEKLEDAGEGDTLSVGEALEQLEDRSFGALLIAPAALACIPVIGGIPGVSVLTGVLVMLICLQHFLPGKGLQVPSFLANRALSRDKLETGIDKSVPWIKWTEQFLKQRQSWLTGGRGSYVMAAVCAFMGFLMLPAALFPWAVTVPAGAVLLLALGTITRDGYMAIAGYVVAAFATWALYNSAGYMIS